MSALAEILPSGVAAPARRSWTGRLTRLSAFAGVFLVLGVLGWALNRARSGPVGSGPAPDFTLTGFDGKTVRLADLRGQVVVVNFWASWCPPCREEAAYLEQTSPDHQLPVLLLL